MRGLRIGWRRGARGLTSGLRKGATSQLSWPAMGVIRGARMVAAFASVSDNYNNQPNTPVGPKCPQMPPNDPGEYVAPNLDKIESYQLLLK